MSLTHHCNSTFNGHNPSFQAGAASNRHQWHSGIIAKLAESRYLFVNFAFHLIFSLLMHLLPGLWPNNGLWRCPAMWSSILTMLRTNCGSCRNTLNTQDLAKVGQEARG